MDDAALMAVDMLAQRVNALSERVATLQEAIMQLQLHVLALNEWRMSEKLEKTND